MAATGREVDSWIEQARKNKFKYIISVCDTFDYDDYPVYCKDKKEMEKKRKEYNREKMQKINEIIEIKPKPRIKKK